MSETKNPPCPGCGRVLGRDGESGLWRDEPLCPADPSPTSPRIYFHAHKGEWVDCPGPADEGERWGMPSFMRPPPCPGCGLVLDQGGESGRWRALHRLISGESDRGEPWVPMSHKCRELCTYQHERDGEWVDCPGPDEKGHERIRELEAENARRKELVADLVRDIFGEGHGCLPECDSYGHAENCPEVEALAAIKMLRAENAHHKKMHGVAHQNNRQLWEALALIRAEIEEHGPVTAGEHLLPEPALEAEAQVKAIAAIVRRLEAEVARYREALEYVDSHKYGELLNKDSLLVLCPRCSRYLSWVEQMRTRARAALHPEPEEPGR